MGVGAGEVGPGIQTPGGTGGSVPKNLILGGASESVASIEIPGLSGSPDIIASTSGNGAFNDEFDENGSGIPAGWTVLPFGALATNNTDDFLSNLHLKTSLTTAVLSGIYKAGPTSFPFTMTAKVTDAVMAGEADAAGIFVCPVTPGTAGTIYAVQVAEAAATPPCLVQTMSANAATGVPTGTSGNNVSFAPPVYLRLVVTATTVAYWVSFGGLVWNQLATSTGLTIATPTVGLFVTSNGATPLGEAAFDWVRFL